MQEIARFFLPAIGSGLVRALAVIFNAACILVGILLLAHLGWTAARRLGRKGAEAPERPEPQSLLLASAIAACAVIFLAWLPYGAAGWDGSLAGGVTNDWVYRVLLDAVDPVLMLRSLTTYPTPLFGLNLIVRALVVWLLGAALLFAAGRVHTLCEAIRRLWASRRTAPRERGRLGRKAGALVGDTIGQILRLLSLIPFTLRHLVRAAQSFLSVMLQIFVGYSTESDKNRAVFVAACFASIASLLNTFFGLTGFYSSDSTPIPVICSFAIACAVQLAMLIFGMKAGEGIAEGMLMEQRFRRGGLLRTMVEKVFYCLMYLLTYAAFLVVLYGGVLSGDGGGAIPRALPYLLTALGTLLMAYALVRQGMDIYRLRKALRAARETGEEPPPMGPERLPRRLPSRWYLAAYLLLMVVSTGFAFNNMFGYYANSAKLHERVYDQVRYETAERLRLSDTVTAMSHDYADNTNAILAALEDGAALATAKRQGVRSDYDTQAGRARDNGNAAVAANLENIRDRYVARTNDFETTVSVIKSFLQMDYDDIGSDVTVTTEEYAHYWKQRAQESYRTNFFSFALPGGRSIVVGTQVTGSVTRSITCADGLTIRFSQDRYPDPDSVDQSIIRTVRDIPNGDKYVILRTLLSQYERLENEIYTTGSPATDMDQIYSLLDKNAEIDGIRGSAASLYAGPERTVKVSVMDLPRVLDAYLGGSGIGSQAENGLTKYAAYEALSVYVDRALELGDLLAGYRESQADGDGAYLAQQFRNYAQGITYSDFQISYDALLHGSLGINPAKGSGITALYSASPIAWFLLLICALVDFSAFFAGLLLFKDIYLFERNGKIEEMGYLNYEAALTTFFTPPEAGPERLFHLAFLYQLLHGGAEEEPEEAGTPSPEPPDGPEAAPEPAESAPEEAEAERSEPEGEEPQPEEPAPVDPPEEKGPDTSRLRAILSDSAFRSFRRSGENALAALGVRTDREDGGLASLQVWLSGFVKKNGITFDELFQEEQDRP